MALLYMLLITVSKEMLYSCHSLVLPHRALRKDLKCRDRQAKHNTFIWWRLVLIRNWRCSYLVPVTLELSVALAESVPKRNGSWIQGVFMLLKFRQHTLIKLAGIASFFAVQFYVCCLDTLFAFERYRQISGISLSHSKSAGIKKAGTSATTFAIFLLGWVLVRA